MIRDLVLGLVAVAVLTGATWWGFDLPARYLAVSVALYGLLSGFILHFGRGHLPGGELGPANQVTLARATLIVPVAAWVPFASSLGPQGQWWIIVLSTLAMVLDGVDGRLARVWNSRTEFGARFDMELDAFLLLALSFLVWLGGRAGPWVLLIGGLRYLFVAAGWVWPRLRGELPQSFRRQMVCVVQGVALLICLGPIIPGFAVQVVAALALAALLYSFGADTLWLLQRDRRR